MINVNDIVNDTCVSYVFLCYFVTLLVKIDSRYSLLLQAICSYQNNCIRYWLLLNLVMPVLKTGLQSHSIFLSEPFVACEKIENPVLSSPGRKRPLIKTKTTNMPETLKMKICNCLYNVQRQKATLNQIVGGLQEIRPGTTINDVKVKINSLRTQFNKEIGKLPSQPSGSGAALVKILMWCFEDLFFLQDQSIVRESFTNLLQQQGCGSWSERVEMEDASSPTQNLDETITETSYSSSTTDGDLEVAPASTSRKRKSANNANKEAESTFKEIRGILKKISAEEDVWQFELQSVAAVRLRGTGDERVASTYIF
ncbi:hypothetical protein RN001_005656 [Aquatica leii]|uniref:MADF domain-containing protein n=1 Tax=Aquatica leii TaxID=1421715 RepID=A0AAN7Q1K6_9COLE|nr:hypothetical protein RN001_005656 [Aquatica leii]